jgi:hypothetical protein
MYMLSQDTDTMHIHYIYVHDAHYQIHMCLHMHYYVYECNTQLNTDDF